MPPFLKFLVATLLLAIIGTVFFAIANSLLGTTVFLFVVLLLALVNKFFTFASALSKIHTHE